MGDTPLPVHPSYLEPWGAVWKSFCTYLHFGGLHDFGKMRRLFMLFAFFSLVVGKIPKIITGWEPRDHTQVTF